MKTRRKHLTVGEVQRLVEAAGGEQTRSAMSVYCGCVLIMVVE